MRGHQLHRQCLALLARRLAGSPRREVPFAYDPVGLPDLKITRTRGLRAGLMMYYGDGIIHLRDVDDKGARCPLCQIHCPGYQFAGVAR